MNKIEESIASVEQARLMDIETHGLTNVDERFNFFYDETNNIRKLCITENNKLNVSELKNFILGGVLHLDGVHKPDLTVLRDILKLHKNITEIKLKHIGQGSFLEILKSKRMVKFLNWFIESNYMVHYHHVDLMYWSVIDVIDSILISIPELQSSHFHLKADFYEVVKCNRELIVNILGRYQYPDIPNSKLASFSKEILDVIELNNARLPHYNYYMLKGLFQNSLKLKVLPFVEGYQAKQLVDNFYAFYLSRIILFKNSIHIFDEELQIEEHFKLDEFILTARKGQFHFVRSHDDPFIQISDIFVGFIGKMHSYLTETSESDIEESYEGMDGDSIHCLKLLNTILKRSEGMSIALIHQLASIYDMNKSAIIFRK